MRPRRSRSPARRRSRSRRTASRRTRRDAIKTFVKAKIEITPDATNEVGKPHTFTVTLQKDAGNGQGFVAAADEHVTVTLTDSNGATHSAPTGSCTTAGANTNASGPVHDHLHLEHGGEGDRACVVDPVGVRFGAVHGRDGWGGAEFG